MLNYFLNKRVYFFLSCLLVYFIFQFINIESETKRINFNLELRLESECDCRSNEIVEARKYKSTKNGASSIIDVYLIDKLNNQIIKKISSHDEKEFHNLRFACDLYNTLRRGPHQNVISFTVYGNIEFYTRKVVNLTREIKNIYPDWYMRVYYDESINKSLRCDTECSKNISTQEYINNADFCNINQMYFNFNDYLKKTPSDLSYVHYTMWRYLPLSESFVDIFSSRDSDSYFLQREADSVDVWLKSNKYGHIMRGKYF
jgi:hypothetical protein